MQLKLGIFSNSVKKKLLLNMQLTNKKKFIKKNHIKYL